MASSLTEVPTREIATDTNNHGLGPTKSNIAPVVDTAHELDAREEELIRDWVRRLARTWPSWPCSWYTSANIR